MSSAEQFLEILASGEAAPSALLTYGRTTTEGRVGTGPSLHVRGDGRVTQANRLPNFARNEVPLGRAPLETVFELARTIREARLGEVVAREELVRAGTGIYDPSAPMVPHPVRVSFTVAGSPPLQLDVAGPQASEAPLAKVVAAFERVRTEALAVGVPPGEDTRPWLVLPQGRPTAPPLPGEASLTPGRIVFARPSLAPPSAPPPGEPTPPASLKDIACCLLFLAALVGVVVFLIASRSPPVARPL